MVFSQFHCYTWHHFRMDFFSLLVLINVDSIYMCIMYDSFCFHFRRQQSMNKTIRTKKLDLFIVRIQNT